MAAASPSSLSTSSSASSPLTSTPSMFVRIPRHGVRRRDDSAVEIEELDSCTMRQNSYNYFQQHSAPSPLRASTLYSPLGRSPSRKRQRTLAEQLDELCLSRKKSRRREKTRQDAKIVELDEFGREKVAFVDGSGSDSDGMMDTSEGLKVYGDVGAGRLRSFFAAGAAERHRPMDRMYRHYVAVAAAQQVSTTPQGNELVVFRPPAPVATCFGDDLPAYLSLTPHEFEKLTMAEKRQWYQAHSRYMRELDHAAEQKNAKEADMLEAKPTDSSPEYEARCCSSSTSSSRSYQVLGVPSTDEDDGRFEDFGDVEMMEDVEDAEPKRPHAAGALTHTEWFTDDEL